jgi:hypothetical protein
MEKECVKTAHANALMAGRELTAQSPLCAPMIVQDMGAARIKLVSVRRVGWVMTVR